MKRRPTIVVDYGNPPQLRNLKQRYADPPHIAGSSLTPTQQQQTVSDSAPTSAERQYQEYIRSRQTAEEEV